MEELDKLVWLLLPLLVAAGSALVCYSLMHARMEVALAKERESLAEARATIASQKTTMEERIKATQESVRRETLDQLMEEFRLEERSYVRESKDMDTAKKLMVMQERMFFRNIPLSNWVEREMVIEEAREALPPGARATVEGPEQLTAGEPPAGPPVDFPSDSLTPAPANGKKPAAKPENRSLVPAQAAFGAQ